jgi:hypothetical protein
VIFLFYYEVNSFWQAWEQPRGFYSASCPLVQQPAAGPAIPCQYQLNIEIGAIGAFKSVLLQYNTTLAIIVPAIEIDFSPTKATC